MSEEFNFKNINDDDVVMVARHFGKTYPLGVGADGEPRYLLGPHYPVFIGTWIFSSCLSIFIMQEMYIMLKPFWFALVLASNIIFLAAYIKVGFSNPGIASRAQQPSEQAKADVRFCKPCKIVRERGTIHCLECDLCIYGHDHHCPWIGKCVGAANLGDFYLFLFMCFGNLIWIMICTAFGQEESKSGI